MPSQIIITSDDNTSKVTIGKQYEAIYVPYSSPTLPYMILDEEGIWI